jgi:polo-like kinase 1
VFVVSWLDYCAKYGMGFAMSDGTVSVHFNDSSSLALAPAKKHAEYVDGRRRDAFALAAPPENLGNKIFLLHKFEGYMLSRLCGTYDYTWEDVERKRDLVYVEKYLRTKNVILFRLSNGILQFNFYDHTKLILSADGLVVTIIDKHYAMHCWTLASLLQPQGDGERERAKHERYITKLEYARSLLARMRAHGGMGATAARVQERERGEREREKEKARETREPREREARAPIRG